MMSVAPGSSSLGMGYLAEFFSKGARGFARMKQEPCQNANILTQIFSVNPDFRAWSQGLPLVACIPVGFR